jgi:hypothetical protein
VAQFDEVAQLLRSGAGTQYCPYSGWIPAPVFTGVTFFRRNDVIRLEVRSPLIHSSGFFSLKNS